MNKLRRHRIDAGLTISELAKRTNVSRSAISAFELGEPGLGPAKLKLLTDYLSKQLGREIRPSELLVKEEA